ncbi:hypothetical protein TNCT_676931 [Trichonephila clavata]|uniref:Uncharacterized protein n=1 Tax=Trichonephila clavata TaxID=2740835 RepID=A0A8X6JA67_TRICU|nr:hypothetical protein TNCT_676931 [Trichonephila clavata]
MSLLYVYCQLLFDNQPSLNDLCKRIIGFYLRYQHTRSAKHDWGDPLFVHPELSARKDSPVILVAWGNNSCKGYMKKIPIPLKEADVG